ncbi:MAG: N-acetyl-gamma-glutamyl-phosphate reductase [Bacteroidales bacterium]|nr:N-acetyl-gamma-glutamyl-phosphate reductase [Bacteroidales bacterium]
MKKISVGIIGGAGYTAGELLRLLLHHPQVDIQFVQSSTQADKPVCSVHRDLFGDTELKFTDKILATDVVFLCLGHGLSTTFLDENPFPENTKIIDLSNDFRVQSTYKNRDFVYGLSEIFRNEIRSANSIANPGCFATAIQLALFPLAEKMLLSDEVHVNAITGSTGAGRGLSETLHYSYRNNNISIYKPFTHQHLGEINKTFTVVQNGKSPMLNFIPVRGNFTRGIFTTLYTKCALNKDELQTLYKDCYASHPFTHISDTGISMKEVANTNKCLLHIEKHGDYVLITSVIDNLLKGASGQAIQNMNLMFGLEETIGLQLKPNAF